jgi:hypothetical protein
MIILILIIILFYFIYNINNEHFDYYPIKLTSYNPSLYDNILDLSNNFTSENIKAGIDIVNNTNNGNNTSYINNSSYITTSGNLNNINLSQHNDLTNISLNTHNQFINRIQLKSTNPYLEIEQILNSNNRLDSSNCCLVTKKFNGDYYYEYEKMSGDKCNIDLYILDKNKELLFDGINGWSNDYINKLGSCRNNNFECKDFVLEDTCNKYKNNSNLILNEFKGNTINDLITFQDKKSLINKSNIKWSEKTCEERVEYIPPVIKKNMDYIQ